MLQTIYFAFHYLFFKVNIEALNNLGTLGSADFTNLSPRLDVNRIPTLHTKEKEGDMCE